MRQKTKMNGLVSHTKPDGRSQVSPRERCINKLNKLEKMLNSGWQITSSEAKDPKEVIVSTLGCKVRMTFDEYKQRGNGLKVIAEIF